VKVSSATTEINASPETIWRILTDGTKYTEWDPGIQSLEGKIASGERLTIFTKLTPGRAFKVTVTEFAPPSKMVWSSGMPMGLFGGDRTFTLEPLQDGKVKFTCREVIGGLLLPLFQGSSPDLNPSFAAFAGGLKARAEQENQ
jgi:hypothetical protein